MFSHREIIGNCTLYKADCEDLLKQLGHFDALVTDPPYGIGESCGKNKTRSKLAVAVDYGDHDWDKSIKQNAINNAINATDYQVIFGGNYYDLPPSPCWLVWDKKTTGNFADCELAWTNLKKSVRKIEWAWNGMIRKGEMNKKPGSYNVRVHPTQKPVGVMEWCINMLPNDCMHVLDPFMGSGTTGVACAKLGLKFTGIEINQEYFDIACKRIDEAYQQPDLFIDQNFSKGSMEKNLI